jgi:plasmid maintenance system antidote protein VapI
LHKIFVLRYALARMAKLSSNIEIDRRILTIRGCKAILDSDLAAIYGVTAKRLNEQLRRNRTKFPPDFAFRLTKVEWANLRSQFATSSAGQSHSESIENQEFMLNWSHFATSSSRRRGATLHTLGLHRTRRTTGSQCAEQPACCRDEHLCYSRVREIA